MTRVMIVYVANVDAEDALLNLLALARDRDAFSRTTDTEAARAVGQLAAVVDGITVMYSAPVPRS